MYALYGTRFRPLKFYPRKFVSEQNLAKPRNIESSKIIGYTLLYCRDVLLNIILLSTSERTQMIEHNRLNN